MKKFFSISALITGVLLSALVFERLFVERTTGPAAVASIVFLAVLFVTLVVMYRLYDTRHRELVGKICLAAAATATSYIVLDLISGFILIQRLSPPLVADEFRHHKMVANSYSSFSQPDFHYVQHVNNFGMRGPDIAVVKPDHSYRILMLGDSFTMGKGVEDDQTFSVLLEHALRKRVAACGSDLSVEVLNGGVDSYAPILSYIELKRDLAPLKPDMVVLNLDVSDLVQESAYRQLAVWGDDGEVVGVPQDHRPPSLTDRIRTWTNQNLFITRALLYYLTERAGYREFTVRSVVEEANFEVAAHTLEGDSEPREQQWRDIFDSLRRIKAFADSRGIVFVLSVYPWGHQVNDSEWTPGRYAFMPQGAVPSDRSLTIIHDLSRQAGIELVDLFPAFRAYKGEKPLYFRYDVHWTTTGHEVAAAGLEAALAEKYDPTWCK